MRLPTILRERIVERGDTVGQRLAEAEHEAHRELVRGGCAKPLGVALAREIRHADQRLRRDRRAGHADLMVAPQHRQRRDGKPRAPGGEQKRRHRQVGKLNRDRVARYQSKLGEERRQGIGRHVGLAIAKGARRAQAKVGEVGRIGQRDDTGPLLRAPLEQTARRERRVLLDACETSGGERAHDGINACAGLRARPWRLAARSTRCRSGSRRAASSRGASDRSNAPPIGAADRTAE